jgi:hypothetical protein
MPEFRRFEEKGTAHGENEVGAGAVSEREL